MDIKVYQRLNHCLFIGCQFLRIKRIKSVVYSYSKTSSFINKSKFSKLHIFSVSLYLRQLYKKGEGQKFIDLDMPHFEHRIKILTKFQNKK